MPQRSARSIRGGDALVRAFAVLVIAGALLLPRISHADPDSPNVLLVANGYYTQEIDIENHLLDLGCSVTRLKDYRLKGTTSLAPYDLVVISEFAPNIPTSGINNLKSAGVPILIVEYWDFSYSYKFGLTTSSSCGYVGTDTITSIREGYDDFTSRVGAEALVYQPQYTVYGIDIANVKPNATPLYWSSASFGEVAVLVDYAKKIAATGVYDTRKYTVDAWKMFDVLLAQILPAPAAYATMDEVAQAYVDSGLYALAADIEADLKQNPQSWTFDEAELYAWQLVTEWGLSQLWDFLVLQLSDTFGVVPGLPPFTISYEHPERPHGDPGPTGDWGFLPSDPPYDQEREFWFLGQYWESDFPYAVSEGPYFWQQYHGGTDLGLGMNAKLNGRYYFYMGDTSKPVGPATVGMWSTNDCNPSVGVQCNDMIVVSSDEDPTRGIDVSPIFEYDVNLSEVRWKPIVIPGVHNAFSSQLQPLAGGNFWLPNTFAPAYTVPTGVAATVLPFAVVEEGSQLVIEVNIPAVVLWYGTATAPGGDDGFDPLNELNPRARPASWAGCSFDGINFLPCYADSAGDAVPFSVDGAPPADAPGPGEPSSGPGEPARFIQVGAVEVNASDFWKMCSTDTSVTPMCAFYNPDLPYWENCGLLLYGSGRPYRKSGLFLAFVRLTDLGELTPSGRPLVYYWTGSEWSLDEQQAASLTHHPGSPDCDNWRRPDATRNVDVHTAGCWPEGTPGSSIRWDPLSVFGELSARLVRSDDSEVPPKIVLLNNNFRNGWVLAWKAPLFAPWAGYFADRPLGPIDTKTYGYGPYIIDTYSDDTYPGSGEDGDDIVLWHTISVWHGDDPLKPTPYGVYTGSEEIPWP